MSQKNLTIPAASGQGDPIDLNFERIQANFSDLYPVGVGTIVSGNGVGSPNQTSIGVAGQTLTVSASGLPSWSTPAVTFGSL